MLTGSANLKQIMRKKKVRHKKPKSSVWDDRTEIKDVTINTNNLRVNHHMPFLLAMIVCLLSIPPALITANAASSEDKDEMPMPAIKEPNQASGHKWPPFEIDCLQLKVGQFKCDPYEIDEDTQQPYGCDRNNLAPVNCTLRGGLICDENSWRVMKSLRLMSSPATPGFADDRRHIGLTVPCQYTNGYSYEITLLMSIFLGMFGVDRFYLGYPAIGLLKFCTLGFLFLGQFIDIILIAMQVVRPADGSYYIIKFFGPRLTIVQQLRQPSYHIPVTISNVFPPTVAHSEFDVFYYHYPAVLAAVATGNDTIPVEISTANLNSSIIAS